MDDHFYMQRCIQLARMGSGYTAPNPMVGSVLVYQDRIIGEGYHRQFGQAHAEVNCINSVSPKDRDLIPSSTLYVSLEPCSHYGKTPPCTDLIIREKIKSVKIGCIDINQKVNGRGVKKLRDAGITVETGINEDACLNLNKRFFTFHASKRPYIILKWAQSVNGMIGQKGERTAISGAMTNMLVHKWRSEESGILIGSRTAQTDNPLLNNRYWPGNNPARIVFAGGNIPEHLRMYDLPGQTIVFSTKPHNAKEHITLQRVSTENYLPEAMDYLYISGIQSLLVEGGTITLQHFLDSGIWDECRIITNSGLVINDGVSAPLLPKVRLAKEEISTGDIIRYYVNPANRFVTKEELYP